VKKTVFLVGSLLIFAFALQRDSETQAVYARINDSVGASTSEPTARSNDSTADATRPGTFLRVSANELRDASSKAIKIIQQSQAVWFKKENCGSCHHQLIPEIPIKLARARGVAVDEKIAQQASENTFGIFKDLDAVVQGYDYIDVLFDGWLLYSAETAGVRPNLSTSASAQFIASRQLTDGSWPSVDTRPPQSYGSFTTTAVCAFAIKSYLPERFAKEREDRLRKAREWFLNALPRTSEDSTYRLLGLYWTGADAKALKKAAQQLLAEQRADGGWSQLPGMQSDAYSTGEVLTAIQECVGLSSDDPAYQRGLQYLLKTQQPDGSWHVSSRLHPPAPVSPPYFETGFPYKHDQFISAMGTSLAAAALLRALPVNTTEKTRKATLDIAPAEQPSWVQVALNGSVAELKNLLDTGMKPDARTADGTTALMLAARDIEKVKLLTERGADVNARAATGINVLMMAARYRGNAEVIRLLLKKGAKPNVENGIEVRNNATPLFLAIMSGDEENVRVLIDSGARIDLKMKIIGRFSQSPLLYATFGSHPISEMLLARGANANEVDDDKISLLSWAAISNHPSIVRLLLAKGAKVNHVDNFGMTPLLYAASIDYGDTAVLEQLLAAGADVSLKNKEGLTALELARNYRHQRIADLLSKKAISLSGMK
jgi:ankyrin repeat protein